MTNILYIDTSGSYSQIILFNEKEVVAVKTTTETNQHAQSIHMHIQEIMNETNMSWQQISAVAVMNGPGSYTGLRIGLASAKGFCYALNLPLILINHLDLMHKCNQHNYRDCAYILKARENEYFMKTYSVTSNEFSEATIVDRTELIATIENETLKCYTSDTSLAVDFPQMQLLHIEINCIQSYVFENFSAKNVADLMHCEPFYLKNVHINKIKKL